jgi:hypothetical protein
MSGGNFQTEVTGHSGWLIPLGVFVVTAALSVVMLVYYLAPTPASFIEQRPSPTSSTDPVTITIRGREFIIPANYLEYRSARRGGPQKNVALFAALPDFHGYTDPEAHDFFLNAPDSPIVYMLLGDERFDLTEAERLQRIYLDYVVDPAGKAGPFGLTQYQFRDDSGYRGEDLFVGRLGKHVVVLRCDRNSPHVGSPSCLRDERLPHHLSLSYRFKRTQLSRWEEIATGTDALMRRFRHWS